MIQFQNLCNEIPYVRFKKEYEKAVAKNQNIVEAICISSFSKVHNEVDSRFVNLKIIDDKDFIFFTNYSSPKSMQFKSHNQISAVIFWSNTNVQIRMKAQIEKISEEFSNEYFKQRSSEKNALAISSSQSFEAESYDQIKSNYQKTLETIDTSIRPMYWGGFSFRPYYFEFWEGHEQRLNIRQSYLLEKNNWIESILQP